MRNRHLFISPDYPPPLVGGSLVYVQNLIENSDLDFTVLTDIKNRKNNLKIRYVETKHIINSSSPTKIQLLKMYFYIFLNLIKFREYKVIVLNISAIGNGFFSYVMSKLKYKVVIIVFAEEITLALKSKGFTGFLKRFALKGYKSANTIVSISNFAKQILREKVGVKSDINVIPTPVHGSKIKYSKFEKKFNTETFKILSVGRLIKRKGFDKLLLAFRGIVEKGYNAELNIIGKGPEYFNLKDYIKKNKLCNYVNIYIDASDDFLINQYKCSNLFILANLMLDNGDCEGAPNVLIEAASFGLPTIAGEEGGTSDVVEHNKSGILLDPRNILNFTKEIETFINDKTKAETMGKVGHFKAFNSHRKKEAGETFSDIISKLI